MRMTRHDFHKQFRSVGPVVLPVVHVRDAEQTIANAAIIIAEGAAGAFLINHDFDYPQLLPIIVRLRERYPALWLGVSFFRVGAAAAFPVLAELARSGAIVDGYWADDARIDEHAGPGHQLEAMAAAAARDQSGWPGLYFGGTAFKGQRPVAPEHHATAARIAAMHMDVVCTSGAGTGKEPDLAKIAAFRAGAGDRPIAVASGITAENAGAFAAHVDCFMVATGINRQGDFYGIDASRLARLLRVAREHGAAS
jgi:hypothetical protein